MNLGISSKRVLIIGGSKGLGGQISECFNNEGCNVTIIARRVEYLERLERRIGGYKNNNTFISADLLQPGEPEKVINSLVKKFGGYDIVVHNLGGALGVKDIFASADEWMDVWKFNVGISIEINNILIPIMVRNGWGRVIHMSSISSTIGEPSAHEFGGAIPYAASKAYINSYVQGIGRELASKNVLVNAVLPGAIKSEGKYWDKMTLKNPKLVEKFISRHSSIGRLAEPEEIASLVVFFASEKATYSAGSLVPVDGGRF